MKKILVLDTETLGLPISWNEPASNVDNWPRVCQLAFELFDETGATIKRVIELVSPDNWEIPTKETFMAKGESEAEAIKKAQFWVDNNFDTETCNLLGLPMKDLLRQFAKCYDECDLLLCHNNAFDKSVISAELHRYKVGIKNGPKPDFCTKLEGEEICKLPSQYPGKYKWPTLKELYNHLFGKDFEGAHNAGCDIQATKECYLEIMLRREYETI